MQEKKEIDFPTEFTLFIYLFCFPRDPLPVHTFYLKNSLF